MSNLNDLQAVDQYIEQSREFIPPRLFRDIQARGLYDIINFLPYDINEAKAIARARMAKIGKSFGDAEIDKIANEVQRIEFLRDQLNALSMTDVDKTLHILQEMVQHTEFVRDYFKENKYLKTL